MSSALVDRHVVAGANAVVPLHRSRDLLVAILQQFGVVREPTGHSRNREQHGEHLDGEAKRLVNQARVEVDVGVQLALHEVVVAKCGLFKFQCDVEQRVLSRHLKYVVRSFLDDLGARVVVLVHAVAETHQAALTGLHVGDEGRNVLDRTDLGQHVYNGFVGTTVQWAVQRRGGRSRRAVGVGVRRCHYAHGGGAAVLLVVGVQDEEQVHRFGEHRVDAMVVANAEHHVQEICRIVERVVRRNERQAHAESVTHRGNGR